jgi:putative dehydrogenase
VPVPDDPCPPSPPGGRSVGVVGIGNMGGGMALNLLARGWRVRVHDLERGKVDALAVRGAVACPDAATAAAQVPITIVAVVDAAQCEAVLWGEAGVHARSGGLAGHTVMLCPTIAPEDVERFAARLAEDGAATIDAPMSGGPQRAADGTMSLMVGCAPAVHASHRSLLEALSSRPFVVGGRPGDGARMKLVNNLLAGINLVGAAEALALAQRLGMDLHTVLAVIEQSSGQSWVGSDRMRRAIAGDYAPRAQVTLLRKDTALALRAAHDAGFEAPLGAAAHTVFERAFERGWGHLDDAVVLRLLSEPTARD